EYYTPPPFSARGGGVTRIHSGRHLSAPTAPGALVACAARLRGGLLIPPRFYSPRWRGSPDSFRASPCSCYRTWRSRRQRWGVPRGDPDPPALKEEPASRRLSLNAGVEWTKGPSGPGRRFPAPPERRSRLPHALDPRWGRTCQWSAPARPPPPAWRSSCLRQTR